MSRTRLTIQDGEVLEIYSSVNIYLGAFSLDSSGNIIIKNGTFPHSAERVRIALGGKVRFSSTSANQILATDSSNDLQSLSVLTIELGGTNNTFSTPPTDGDILYFDVTKYKNLASVAT